jgi:hypothetical protein
MKLVPTVSFFLSCAAKADSVWQSIFKAELNFVKQNSFKRVLKANLNMCRSLFNLCSLYNN